MSLGQRAVPAPTSLSLATSLQFIQISKSNKPRFYSPTKFPPFIRAASTAATSLYPHRAAQSTKTPTLADHAMGMSDSHNKTCLFKNRTPKLHEYKYLAGGSVTSKFARHHCTLLSSSCRTARVDGKEASPYLESEGVRFWAGKVVWGRGRVGGGQDALDDDVDWITGESFPER